MTDLTRTGSRLAERGETEQSRLRSGGVLSWPAVAGITYVAAWLIGLVVAPSAPALDTSPSGVAAYYSTNAAASITQALLVHGLAGVALAAVVIAIYRVQRQTEQGVWLMVALGAGIVAVVLSLTQTVLGVVLPAAAGSDASLAAGLSDGINRLDGVKMLALAVMASGMILGDAQRLFPRWLAWTAVALVVSLIGAGIAYALLSTSLAPIAYVALPLLLLWVAGAAITVGGRSS